MIFGPICHVGWESACSAVTSAELVAGATAEGAARGGQDDGVDTVALASLEALMERGVLTVDREEKPSPTLLCRDRELARCDEALLVRERERDSVLERPERRADAREADDRVQDDVGLAPLEQRDRVAADLDVLERVLGGKPVERRRPRHERTELELRMRADDVDRLTADRPCRAEDRDACHAARMPDRP